MQAIIVIHNGQATSTFRTTHAEKMHCFIIHAHQLAESPCLLRINIGRMQLGTNGSETGIQQIKIIACMVVLNVANKRTKDDSLPPPELPDRGTLTRKVPLKIYTGHRE